MWENSRRILGVHECIILYEILLPENRLYGVFTGGKELQLVDSHFTDERIAVIIDRLIVGDSSAGSTSVPEFVELELAVRTGEVRALNEIYLKYGNSC